MVTDFRLKLGVGLALLLLSTAPAHGQTVPAFEVGLGYSYVHSNAPPGGCGCFNMNGGAGEFGVLVGHNLSAVAEAGVYVQNDVNNSGRSLRFETILFGPRYTFNHWRKWSPFAQGLFGGSLGSGTLYGPNATTSGSASGFSLSAGGGLDWKVSRRVSVRLIQAEYMLTRFPNSTDNDQNNLRISAGVVFHFGEGSR
jgi:peptidoglycan-associated lipoprotein